MPLSRPVLIALAGAVLAMAAFFATSGSRQQAAEPAPSPPKQAESQPTPAKPKAQAAKAQAAEAKAETPAKPKAEGVPPAFKRALDQKRVVVLFFGQPGSADNSAVANAVKAQRGRRGVSVFADDISRLGRYSAVVGSLGIAQAPAVVIVGRNGEASIAEGYMDERSLTQQVVDAK